MKRKSKASSKSVPLPYSYSCPLPESVNHRHMHEDEEIRYILSGSGFFDIRETPTDAWMRLAVEPGDLIVIPAGIYHRFTLDEADKIKALRLFKVCISYEIYPALLYLPIIGRTQMDPS